MRLGKTIEHMDGRMTSSKRLHRSLARGLHREENVRHG